MRKITDHRFEGGDFNEAFRGVLRNSPWWMLSAVAHAVALAILWSIPFQTKGPQHTSIMTSSLPDEQPEIDPIDEELPEPIVPPDTVDEAPPDIDDEEVQTTRTDEDIFTDLPDEGDPDNPYVGPTVNTAIGVGPGGGGRGRGKRGQRMANITGGDGRTIVNVLDGLKWLADHQDIDAGGRWDCDDFMKHDPPDDRCDGPGSALHDVGVTGLALLAFLGADYTDRGTHPFARHVRYGLRFLQASQDEDGVFGSRASHSFMYSHAIATLAMSEAYWMTRNPRYKKPAQDGLNFMTMARNPYMAWRYEPRGGDNDTSVTGWCVMALKSGRFAGLEVDPDAFEGARMWIDKMTDPNFGQVGYDFPGGAPARPEGKADRFPPEKSQSMTAVGILTRIFLGEDPRTSPMIRKGADLCVQTLPVWNPDDGSIDMYYWYYATLAIYQVGGPHWRQWNKAMKDAIIRHQHGKNTGSRKGSWDPIGAWGDDGGRVYSTATMVMCLEVYYRYGKVFGTRN
jgi:hypothetical protein